MKRYLNKIVSNRINLIIIFCLFSFAASIQSLVTGTKTYYDGGIEYTKYNNYTIFKKSYDHLLNGQDLYVLYPEEHWDLFKYTPTFSVFFGLFAIFPDWLGLNMWNLLNALILLFSIYYLPKLSEKEKGWILLLVLIELMTSMQNEQSNGLIAGLIILSFGLLEKRKYMPATFCIVFSVFIKLFGLVGFSLFLFYPKKWKLIVYSIGWVIFLLGVPLIFIGLPQYLNLAESYWSLLANDHSTSYGYSVMGWLNLWFGVHVNKLLVVAIGVSIFMAPLVRINKYKQYAFRYLALTSVLIWVVIFNHKAESPTFIIAMAGVALWYVWSEKNMVNNFLFISAFILTSLSPTDLFPRFIRNEFFKPYVLKVFPCILIWIKIIYDMMVLKNEGIPLTENRV